MAVSSHPDDPRHSEFLDLCLLYGDFNRPVFLKAIRHCFLESASTAELESLRRAFRDRAKSLRQHVKKGRPRAEQSAAWISSTLKLVWMRDIEGKSWRQIAQAAGLKPTRPNLRTVQVRRDLFAVLVLKALPPRTDDPAHLDNFLDNKRVQLLLRSRLALPFLTHPRESRKIVQVLVSRGLTLEAARLRGPAK